MRIIKWRVFELIFRLSPLSKEFYMQASHVDCTNETDTMKCTGNDEQTSLKQTQEGSVVKAFL